MFDKEYLFLGSHAEKVKDLNKYFNEKYRLFERYIDVYMLSPIIGFLYKRKANLDKTSNETAKIFTDQLTNESQCLKYNFQLIMLLDKDYEQSFEKRLDKAFRYESGKYQEDVQLYEEYVRGGVDILHEKLIEGTNSSEDYVKKLYDFLEEFNDRYYQENINDKIIDFCKLARN